MRLSDYLPTRTFELAVHTADLAAVLGVPPDVTATPVVVTSNGLYSANSARCHIDRKGPTVTPKN